MEAIEALFTKLIFYAYEGGDVETFDVPGDYLHAEISIKNGSTQTLMTLCGNNV